MKTVETEATTRNFTRPAAPQPDHRGLRITGFVLIWLWLDAWLNARYPGDEPLFWYLIPSPDLIVIFLCFMILGQLEWRLPKVARGGLVAWFFLVRLIRLGDGVQFHYYAQPFNLYTDLPLVPELIRFAESTLKWWQFGFLALSTIAILLFLAVALYRALDYGESFLGTPKNGYWVLGLGGLSFLLTSLFGHSPRYESLYHGGFAASALPRLSHEFAFLRNVYGKRAEESERIAQVDSHLSQIPNDLLKLAGKNVYLILVESYGQTVLDRPEYVDSMAATFDSFEAELGARGFAIVSDVLDSPTYGGHSWLAHATLGTGVRTTNQFDYEVLCATKPKALASFFRDAGYRTVVAQPGTTRAWPKGDFFGFEQKYYLWNFDYVGPAYAWANMPDQYVLDFIRRRELMRPTLPLFIQYVLVSSHAPWSDLPLVVDDWSTIQNGDLYNHIKTTHYPIVWPNFAHASEAYVASIKYDFEVLKRYLAAYVSDDSLVIILGDHQPVAEVNENSASRGVPVHVLSRAPALLQPFQARGYTPGMRPHRIGKRRGLDTLLPDFLSDFSIGTRPARTPLPN